MTTTPTWKAEITQEHHVVPTEKRDGTKGIVHVTITRIFLLRGSLGLVFRVGRGRNGQPVITDERETLTGHASPTGRQYQTAEYCKSGPVRKLTPTGWIAEVTRLIGAERAHEVIAEIA